MVDDIEMNFSAVCPKSSRTSPCKTYNPIEKAMARSFNILRKTIGRLLNLFSKEACINDFCNSGYDRN
jgi:hypothetical protein